MIGLCSAKKGNEKKKNRLFAEKANFYRTAGPELITEVWMCMDENCVMYINISLLSILPLSINKNQNGTERRLLWSKDECDTKAPLNQVFNQGTPLNSSVFPSPVCPFLSFPGCCYTKSNTKLRMKVPVKNFLDDRENPSLIPQLVHINKIQLDKEEEEEKNF